MIGPPSAREVLLKPPQHNEAVQDELERRFFQSLCLPNFVFKTTSSHRLDDLNLLTAKHLPRDRRLRVLDVAISSGISTSEWAIALEEDGIEHTLVGSDVYIDATLISFFGIFHVLIDRHHRDLQYELIGISCPARVKRLRNCFIFLPFVISLRLLFSLLKLLVPIASVEVMHSGDTTRRSQLGSLIVQRTVSLISPRVRSRSSFEIVELDLTQPFPRELGRFDVIRAANILNHTYFSEEMLAKMVIHLKGSLADDGLLIVSRTDSNGVNNGSIFRRSGEQTFAHVASLGKGSEITDIVMDNVSSASTLDSERVISMR